jgi:glycosyltransferase involved in cell wall biosynthesis
LRVAFLTPSLSRTAGGIFEIERRLAQTLGELGDVNVEVFGLKDQYTEEDLLAWRPLNPRAFRYYGPQNFRYSPALRRAFLQCDADVAHLHAIWMYTSIVLKEWARRTGKPYLVTLNGFLEPWALRNAQWKKKISALLYENDCLQNAACLHVNSAAELRSVRDYGLCNPVCVIPNGVDLKAQSARLQPAWEKLVPAGTNILLYLGRLHPKKGLPNLIRAWKQLSKEGFPPLKNWKVAIAGWDQDGHEHELKTLVKRSGIEQDFIFLGPLYDEAKDAALERAAAVILPSFSEGLPMSILEAWSYAKSVLMTPECNLPEGFAADAALRIGTTENEIAVGVRQLLEMSADDRVAMGARGRALVAEKFSWSKIGEQVHAVYEWIINGGPAPDTVRFD